MKRSFLATLAAVIALLAALSIAAAATGFFGLRDVLLPEKGGVYVTDENGVVVPGEREYKDFVSLSGWQDTPESRALAEWRSFLESYDRDGAIIGAIGNSPTGFEEEYGLYQVYTREMADRLEEITAKYGLRLHSRLEEVLPESWETVLGDFLGENATAYTGYIYENGTFRFDGEAALEGYGSIEYQFSRSVRGTFDDVALNIGDEADFRQWEYETPDGAAVTLALGKRDRSVILADLGDCFVLVNVLTGEAGDDTFSSGPIGAAELEALADSFRFPALSPARQPDFDALLAENARQMEALQEQPPEDVPEDAGDPLYEAAGIETDAARAFVWDLTELLADGEREKVADLFVYPCAVYVPDGAFTVNTPEELLEYYDEAIGGHEQDLIPKLDYSTVFAGSGLVGVGDGTAWFGLVEDGAIRLFSLWSGQGLGVGRVINEPTQN